MEEVEQEWTPAPAQASKQPPKPPPWSQRKNDGKKLNWQLSRHPLSKKEEGRRYTETHQAEL
jgi:hypothetical protein